MRQQYMQKALQRLSRQERSMVKVLLKVVDISLHAAKHAYICGQPATGRLLPYSNMWQNNAHPRGQPPKLNFSTQHQGARKPQKCTIGGIGTINLVKNCY